MDRKHSLMVGFGAFFAVAGFIWTLQGLDLLGQSGGMNGNHAWAVIGPIVALCGVASAVYGFRGRRPPPV